MRVKLDCETKSLRQFDTELAALEDKKKMLDEAIEGFVLEKKQLEDNLANIEKSLNNMQSRLTTLTNANPWILDLVQ